MQDPKNADRVADAADVTGHSKDVNKAALKHFLDMGFWAANDDGLPRNKLEATAELMRRSAPSSRDKEPVTLRRPGRPSVWKDANAMVKCTVALRAADGPRA